MVRDKKKELKTAEGTEELGLIGCNMMAKKEKHHSEIGKYLEGISHSASLDRKKSKVLFTCFGIVIFYKEL